MDLLLFCSSSPGPVAGMNITEAANAFQALHNTKPTAQSRVYFLADELVGSLRMLYQLQRL